MHSMHSITRTLFRRYITHLLLVYPTEIFQAFALCCVHEWNLSFSCLLLFEIREKLCNLKGDDPIFWNELNSSNHAKDLPPTTTQLQEDLDVSTELDYNDIEDNSSVPLSVVMKQAHGNYEGKLGLL